MKKIKYFFKKQIFVGLSSLSIILSVAFVPFSTSYQNNLETTSISRFNSSEKLELNSLNKNNFNNLELFSNNHFEQNLNEKHFDFNNQLFEETKSNVVSHSFGTCLMCGILGYAIHGDWIEGVAAFCACLLKELMK